MLGSRSIILCFVRGETLLVNTDPGVFSFAIRLARHTADLGRLILIDSFCTKHIHNRT